MARSTTLAGTDLGPRRVDQFPFEPGSRRTPDRGALQRRVHEMRRLPGELEGLLARHDRAKQPGDQHDRIDRVTRVTHA